MYSALLLYTHYPIIITQYTHILTQYIIIIHCSIHTLSHTYTTYYYTHNTYSIIILDKYTHYTIHQEKTHSKDERLTRSILHYTSTLVHTYTGTLW